MKVPLSWLHAFVDVDDLTLDDLVDVMSLHGLEVEEIHRPGSGTRGVITKRVTDRRPHPDADKLQVVRVTDGHDEIELVCGAHNFEVGDVVAHAEVGAAIPGMRLERREIRGVVSNGMLCSPRELQLADDHSGILRLPPETPLGTELGDLLPLGEPVVEVAVLADRGDHHSVLGIARELAAILDRPLRTPAPAATEGPEPLPVDLAGAAGGCHRFVATAVTGVRPGPSPWWLRQRLAQCGVRSIDVVVDVTNYVMLELGQPLHAFDLARLHGPRLEVRWARAGERLTTLDDVERQLTDRDLVIADDDRLVSLAGVMGGADTEVGPATTDVLIEGAVWDPLTIRRTSRRLGLVSEASLRFERRVDPALAPLAVARAVELLVELAGGTAIGTTDVGEHEPPRPRVALDTDWCRRFLGLPEVTVEQQRRFLERLGCAVTVAGAVLEVTPPSWRGDLGRPADLAEEVARLHGYENIPARLPAVTQRGGHTPTQRAEREVRSAARSAGFHEVRSRPFVGADALAGVVPSEGRVVLENPLAKDAAAMSPTLVEGLLGAVRRNVGQGRPGTALFEVARIFRPAGDPVEDTLKAFGDAWRWRDPEGRELPTQPRVLALAAQGLRHGDGWLDEGARWSVYDLLAVLDDVVARLAPSDDASWRLQRRPVEREGFHPGRTAVLELRGTEVGLAGQLHPREADRRDLPEPVAVAELLLDPLLEHLATSGEDPVAARPLVRHPAVTVDVAVVAPDDVPYARVEAAVRAGAGELLDELWWFDEYRGEQLGAGRRSLAIRLRLQSPQRQLTDEDAEGVISAVGTLVEDLGAHLRR